MTTNNPSPRRINCAALRTLHDLERTMQRHIAELHAVDCEDLEAADALVFAIEAAEKALDHARVARRGVTR